MNKVQTLLIILFLANNTIAQSGFTISLRLTGFSNGTKFYLEDPETQTRLDSAVCNSKTITFKGRLSGTPKLLFINAVNDKKYYWCNLFIGNDNIKIEGDKTDFPFYLKKTGSASQDVYQILNDQTKWYDDRRDKLVDGISGLMMDTSTTAKSKWDSTWHAIKPLDLATDSIRKNFVATFYNSYAGLNELFYLKNKFEKDSIQKMYNNLQAVYKNSWYGERLHTYLKVGDILKTGDDFADFAAFDTAGVEHQLSEYKEKYMLLDFTETYCGPCIYAVKELKAVDSMYKEKLNIISFYADKSKDIVLKGVLRDRPSWYTLWDGKGPYGETVLKYGVTGYPSFFLIDPKGKIVWKGSGYGEGSIKAGIDQFLK